MTRPLLMGLALALAACGARTGLEEPDFDAAVSPDAALVDAHAPDAGPRFDAAPMPIDAGRDAPSVDAVFMCVDQSCDDGVPCTVDRCDAEQHCVFEPDSSRCPTSFRCDPVFDCVARALVNDSVALYEVDLPTGVVHALTPLDTTLTDIALAEDGTLYGAGLQSLVRVDPTTGATSSFVPIPGTDFVGLDVGPTGTMYGQIDDIIVEIDRVTGDTVLVARMPRAARGSGDIAYMDGSIYATVIGGRTDLLVRIDLATRAPVILGDTGFRCLYALAPRADILYGLSCEGALVVLDRTTGRGRLVARTGLAAYGAAAR